VIDKNMFIHDFDRFSIDFLILYHLKKMKLENVILRCIFSYFLHYRSEIDKINWAAPSDTFPRFAKLLGCDSYTYNVLLGFTVSVGGITESLVSVQICSII
jgi:hypothetical protein